MVLMAFSVGAISRCLTHVRKWGVPTRYRPCACGRSQGAQLAQITKKLYVGGKLAFVRKI